MLNKKINAEESHKSTGDDANSEEVPQPIIQNNITESIHPEVVAEFLKFSTYHTNNQGSTNYDLMDSPFPNKEVTLSQIRCTTEGITVDGYYNDNDDSDNCCCCIIF
jgi:hypothetical protein